MAASMTVLFWNVQGKDLTASIARMMRVHRIDFVVLAEIPRGDGDKARERLEEEAELPVVYANRRGELAGKTHLYSARSESYAIHRASNPLGRLNVFEINAPPFPPFILGAVHLLSKRNASEEDRSEEAQQVTLDLREECRQLDSNVLLICGDFNLNPFEKGMRSPRYFPAVMDRRLAIKGPRVIQERSYPMLYNPMWSLFGDHPTGPPGTYFHSRARSDALANDRPISPIARVAYDRRCLGRRHPLRRRHTKLPHERRTHPSGPCILRSPSHPPASKKNTMSGLHFWPEDMFNDLPSSPVAILKEAAKELGSATKGVVDAEVKLRSERSPGGKMVYAFVLISKALGFRYTLFDIQFSPTSFYPCDIGLRSGTSVDTIVRSEAEMRQKLAELLHAQQTVSAVKTLVAQSVAA